ncbi:hypothetical protein PI126_g20734 [Phytophthora idaei]|nr:hypothetical protein PI126_g20734 [Phytophthora idaei]
MVYEFEMWVMVHSAGVDVVLGTDFMIPAGIRRWTYFMELHNYRTRSGFRLSRRGTCSTVKNTALM